MNIRVVLISSNAEKQPTETMQKRSHELITHGDQGKPLMQLVWASLVSPEQMDGVEWARVTG